MCQLNLTCVCCRPIHQQDIEDLQKWAVPNDIDFIAASFVRKGVDLDVIRNVLGEKGAGIKIISKVGSVLLLHMICFWGG